jgi:hypothetical protein
MQERYIAHFVTVPTGMPYTVQGSTETQTYNERLKTLVLAHPKGGCFWLDSRGRQCHAHFSHFFHH